MLYLVISSKRVYHCLLIDIYLRWVIHMSMPSAESLVTKVWSIAQTMFKSTHHSVLPISFYHITHKGLIAHLSGRGMGVSS